MRQKFLDVIPAGSRRLPVLLSCFVLSLGMVLATAAAAQEPKPAEEPSEDPNRKAANISWNPKLTFDEWKALDKVRFIEFDRKLGAASLTDAEKKPLLKHLTNQVYGLTLEQNVDRHAIIIDNITRPAEQPGTSPAVREFLYENILKLVDAMLKEQPPQPPNVQYSLVLLVARLNAKPANLTARPPVPAQPYPPSQQLLMKVLLDQGMPIAVRIIAARGLERLMRDGDISTVDKSNIGVAIAKALEQKIDNPLARKWYRWKLVEGLGVTGRYEETGYRPVIIDALMGVLVNREDAWEVRAAAARSLSQLPLDQKTNVELVNYEVVRLLHDLTVAYNASDKTPPSTWRWAFNSVYLAYKSPTAADQTVKHWGLMHLNTPRGRDQISSAYKVVLPVVKPILESQVLPPIEAAKVKALADWLNANAVADRKPTPSSSDLPNPPAAPPQAAQQPPAGAAAGTVAN